MFPPNVITGVPSVAFSVTEPPAPPTPEVASVPAEVMPSTDTSPPVIDTVPPALPALDAAAAPPEAVTAAPSTAVPPVPAVSETLPPLRPAAPVVTIVPEALLDMLAPVPVNVPPSVVTALLTASVPDPLLSESAVSVTFSRPVPTPLAAMVCDSVMLLCA